MFKKAFKAGAYLIVLFVMGLAIYFVTLNPSSNPYKQLKAVWKSYKLSTKGFFSAQLVDENNHSQNLSQYRGKILVVNFWATWCPTCREEMPDLSAFYKENVQNNVAVLGIAVDKVEKVKAYVTQTPVAYPIFSSEEKAMELSRDLGNDFGWLPYTIIIDRQGKVAKIIYGRINKANLQKEINSLLAINNANQAASQSQPL